MEKKKIRLIVGIVLGVVALFYIGAMFGFFPLRFVMIWSYGQLPSAR